VLKKFVKISKDFGDSN